MNWNVAYFSQFAIFLSEYFFFAGSAYLLLYVLLPKFFLQRKVNKMLPASAEVRREILYSVQSLAIFSAVGLGLFAMSRAGWTQFYFRIDQHGWAYFWLSVLLFILLHDTWFYWTHRLLHWPPLYRIAHRTHHRSRHPTPWASFAFHPLEAVVQASVYPAVTLMLPMHPYAGVVWLAYMVMMNVFLHLGFELLPPGFTTHRLFRWHNTTVHHDMHHSYSHSNYGLYFNFWDRLMGTNHEAYEKTFQDVTLGANGKCKKALRARGASTA